MAPIMIVQMNMKRAILLGPDVRRDQLGVAREDLQA
jgi:hypothetical protein